jgi:subtilase family serine protease
MDADYNPSDMAMYFNHEKSKAPFITEQLVFGGAPYPSPDSVETHLDIQQSAGMAPKAAIVLYNVPDLSDQSLLAGLVDIDEQNAVDIVSMSFGAPEVAYGAAYNGGQDMHGILAAYDALFRQGNAEGITFVASSGDAGAMAAAPIGCFAPDAVAGCGDFGLSVEYPASSPYVTAVGGANLVTTSDPSHPADLNSAYVAENAYYDRFAYDVFYDTPAQGAVWGSGGGVSLFEPKPAWQSLAPTGSATLRTVPDVAGHMGGCPNGVILPCPPDRSADMVAFGGEYYDVIGTSASAPDFAGLLALKAQRLQQRLGNENPELYRLGHAQRAHLIAPVFRDGIPGNNGFYPATPGYNLVLGNGTVRGRAFIGAMNLLPAGIPQTATNP